MLCLVVWLPWTAPAGTLELALLLSGDGAEYRQVAEAIEAEFGRHGAPAVTFKVLNVKQYSAEQLASELQSAPALAVTVGIRATSLALEREAPYPVLATLVPRLSYEALLRMLRGRQPERDFGRHSALYLEQPLAQQVRLAQLLNPGPLRLGLMLGPRAAEELPAADIPDIPVRSVVVSDKDAVADTLASELSEIDLLLTVYDPAIIDRRVVSQILYAAYRRRVAVLGYSETLVAAGALAALHSDSTQVGRHTAELIQTALERKPLTLGEPQYPRYFRLRCNEAVARYLELDRVCLDRVRQELGAEP